MILTLVIYLGIVNVVNSYGSVMDTLELLLGSYSSHVKTKDIIDEVEKKKSKKNVGMTYI